MARRKWDPAREMPATAEHGRYTTYNNYKCKCDPCRDAYREYCRDYRARNREKVREADRAYKQKLKDTGREAINHRRWRYKVDDDRFQQMLAGQDNVCAICAQPFGAKGPHIDHDHECCPGSRSCGKCVRGLLCWLCNSALGKFRDDPEALMAAASYVVSNSATGKFNMIGDVA